MEDKDRDDVMQRLLELGGDKKYLTFDDLNRELPDTVVSPDDIEDVLQKLEGSNIPVADSDERLLEQAAATVTDDDEEALDEDIELDLSAGALEKTNDPVRLYLREMGVVPLLTREGEVSIAKRIERGQIKTQKSISRSPIAVKELLKIGEELEANRLNIRDSFRGGLKEWERLRAELKLLRGKKSKKLLRLKRKVARMRLEISHEIKQLNLTEKSRQRLIDSIRKIAKEIRVAEREVTT